MGFVESAQSTKQPIDTSFPADSRYFVLTAMESGGSLY